LPEYTSDLLDLLHVLGRLIALEPAQSDLLDGICASRLCSAEELRAAGALADGDEKMSASKSTPNNEGSGELRGKVGRAPRSAKRDRA
jgi:hypothetical protein